MRHKPLRFHDRYESETVVRLRPNSEDRVQTNSEVQLMANERYICCNFNTELFQFDVYITEIKNNFKRLFLKVIVEIMQQVTKMCVLVYELYVQRIFIIETHFQKLVCTEKARNFREFFGQNRICPKVRLEYNFLSFLIFEDIQNLKKYHKVIRK